MSLCSFTWNHKLPLQGCVAFLVAHVFENHAGPAEFVRCLVNLWILILLNLHTWHLCKQQ